MFFISLLICFISGTFGFYPGPMYGDVYAITAMNPFFQPFMKNQWLQPYFQHQISNFPEDTSGIPSPAPVLGMGRSPAAFDQAKPSINNYTRAVDEPEPIERQINGYDRQPDFSEWLYQDWLANNKPNYPLQHNNYNWWHKNHRWWPKRKQWSYTKITMKGENMLCGGTVTKNNSNWDSVAYSSVRQPSNCAINVATDFHRHKRHICQVRLNFEFTITQPNDESVCNVDLFQVNGPKTKVQTLCGDARDQHMYLDVDGVDDIKLAFTFGQTNTVRYWKFNIALLPCGASYLAPKGCLQYFTGTVGSFHSFNWKDSADFNTRQLANMDYQICFRPEIIKREEASTLCLTPCKLVNGGEPFSISTANSKADGTGTLNYQTSQSWEANCNNDYIVFPGGYNPAVDPYATTNSRDRYCGERFNTAYGASSSATVCTTAKSFNVYYRTNEDETLSLTADGETGKNGNGNQGFCFDFQQYII